MNRLAFAVLAAVLLAPATGAGTPGGKTAAPPGGKLRAPVVVTAELGAGSAQVTVRFDAAASGVRVDVSGLDGLAVKSGATPIAAARFERGAVATFDVAFTPGSGRSFLSVAVSGDFGGAPRAAVTSFPVGQKAAGARKPGRGLVQGSDGERVKVLPSGK